MKLRKGSTLTAIACAVAVLAVIIACAQAAGNQRTERTLAALYDRAYYDLYTGLEDIQVKLDKLRLLPNGGASSELAADVWRQSYAVSLNLTTLPISPEYATVLMRYANQLGAYCMAIARQETITEQNRTDLAALGDVCGELCDNLSALQSGAALDAQYWSTSLDALGGLPMDGLAAQGVDYPTLQYDGPFADAETAHNPVSGEPVSYEQAQQIAVDFVGAARVVDAAHGSDNVGQTPAWGVDVTVDTGDVLHVSVTQAGGHVLWMLSEQKPQTQTISDQQAQLAAQNFLKYAGFEDMTVTGTEKNGAVLTVCLAQSQDGVLCYPDMIKAQISLEDGQVIGYDASAYLNNHRQRALGAAQIETAQALEAVPELTVSSLRLCVIPLNEKEYFCYELTGQRDGETYYVYLDAMDASVLTVLKQVQDPDSTLTI